MKKNFWKYFLPFLICLFLGQGLLYGQNHNYLNWTTEDGLHSNYVYGALEDNDGFIWAFTENGISKFDGYNFKTFTTNDGLLTNDIVYAVCDKKNRIWLWGYQAGVTFIQNDSVYVIDEFSNQNCKNLMYDEEGISMLCNDHNFIAIDSSLNIYQKDFKGESIFDKYRSKNKTVIFDFPNNEIILVKGTDSIKITTEPIRDINNFWTQRFSFEIANDVFIKYFDEKFLIFDFNTLKIRTINLTKHGMKNRPSNALTQQKEKIMFLNKEGFILFDSLMRVSDKLSPKNLSSTQTLHRFFKDSKNNIWIGSRSGGLFMIPFESRNSEILNSPNKENLAFEQLMVTNQNKLLAFTDRGKIMEITNHTIRPLDSNNKSSEFKFRNAFELNNNLYIGGIGQILNNDVNIFDSSINEYLFYKMKNAVFDSSLNNAKIDTITPNNWLLNSRKSVSNNTNKIWLLHNEDLYYTRLKGNLPIIKNLKNSITSLDYSEVNKTPTLASKEGLIFSYNNNLGTIDSIYFNDTIGRITNTALVDQNLYISTDLKGFYIVNLGTKYLINLNNIHNVNRIRYDKNHNEILISSSLGLYTIDNLDIKRPPKQYSLNQGLSSNEVSDALYFGDNIYVATYSGINLINPSNFNTSIVSNEDLKITSILVNQTKRDQFPEVLNYDQNYLQISYKLQSYASNKHIKYYTKLEPLQEDWYISENTSVNYLNLQSGKYTFKLKAIDIYGNEFIYPNPIHFTIKLPYYQTFWFYTLLISLIAFVIWKIQNKKSQAFKKKTEEERKLNIKLADLELSALRAQMNPHFVFNSLGAIQYYIQISDIKSADNYLTRFALLMRKYLDSSKEKMISLHDEISLLKLYTELEKVRFESKFDVKINVKIKGSDGEIFIPSMMIQPFVENAINHGLMERVDGKGLLQINVSGDDNLLICDIIDNGIGMESSSKQNIRKHKSRAMQIIKEKIETLKTSGLANVSYNTVAKDPNNKEFPGVKITIKFQMDDFA